jgi:hypothetical protein
VNGKTLETPIPTASGNASLMLGGITEFRPFGCGSCLSLDQGYRPGGPDGPGRSSALQGSTLRLCWGHLGCSSEEARRKQQRFAYAGNATLRLGASRALFRELMRALRTHASRPNPGRSWATLEYLHQGGRRHTATWPMQPQASTQRVVAVFFSLLRWYPDAAVV